MSAPMGGSSGPVAGGTADGGADDVSRIRNAVRDAIRRRRDEPVTPAELAVAQRLAVLAEASDVDPQLLAHLLAADGRWNIAPDYRIESRWRGLRARALVPLKRLVRPLVRSYTDPVIVRQVQLNLFLLHAVRALLAEVARLQRAVAAVADRREPAAGRGDGASRP